MKVIVNRFARKFMLMLAGVAVLSAISALGQVIKGSISGTVVDAQDAVIAGAQVKATQIDTGAVFTATSDGSGLFRINLIPAGNYKVEITAQGFRTAVQSNVQVTAGADMGLGSVRLTVGGATETVEVTDTAPLVEASQAQVTNTFSGVALQEFAGVQENEGLDTLALFVPGVASSRDNGFSNSNGGQGFSSNGLRGRNNDQEIDGQNNNDNDVGGAALFLSDPNWVQQYVITTNNFGPEYGRNAGSVVNVITKSGGNAWHGSIYGNENNSDLNSLTSLEKNVPVNGVALSGPPRANDEFAGFTIGGPVVKNRFFLFGGFNQEITSSNTVYASGLLTPTPAGLGTLAGCFPTGPSAAAVNALTHFGPAGITAGNPSFSNLTTLAPSQADGCAGVQAGTVSRVLPTPIHTYDFVTRADLQFDHDTITGRYLYNRSTFFNLNDNGAAGYTFNEPALSQAVLLSETHSFSPRMANELRGSFDRENVQFAGSLAGTEPSLNNLNQAISQIAFTDPGFLGFGENAGFPQGRFVNTWQIQDNWSYIWGKHQIKAGVNWTYQQSPENFLPFQNGLFVYGDQNGNPGGGLSGLLANRPLEVLGAIGNPELGLKEYDTFGYIGDDWKIRPNLTLNLGITYTYYGQPANQLNTLDTANETGPNPLFNPALPLSVRVAPKIASYNTAIGPSFGFAYSPQWGGFLTGHGKTVIRGGYRLLYDPPYYNIYLNNYGGAPNILQTAVFPTAGQPLLLPAVPTGQNSFASIGSAFPVGQLDPRTLPETAIPNDFRADQVHEWSLGIQREVTHNSAFEIRYVGNHAGKLFQTVDQNPFVGTAAQPGLAQFFPNLVPAGVTACTTPGAVGFGRENCNEGIIVSRNNTGFSNYNALQTQYRATNLFKQLTLNASYTYSKTLDNVSEIFGTGSAGSSLALSQNPFNTRGAEYSNSGIDFPNAFTINFVEQLPFFKEQHGFIGHLLGGWGFSGDYIWESGQTYTPFESALANATSLGDFFDLGIINQVFGGVGIARPFLGSPNAPVNTVGIFAGDACTFFGASSAACGVPANQLISLNSLNGAGQAVNVTNGQVHFIANTGIAQSLFGTPFGNAPRNALRDARTNTANFTFTKSMKLSERAAFEFRASFLNVFNHANFQGVVPQLENAGLAAFGAPFATPSRDIDAFTGATDAIPGQTLAASRRIFFGGTLTF